MERWKGHQRISPADSRALAVTDERHLNENSALGRDLRTWHRYSMLIPSAVHEPGSEDRAERNLLNANLAVNVVCHHAVPLLLLVL